MKSSLVPVVLAASMFCGFAAIADEKVVQDKHVKIGVLSDMAGPYAEIGGAGPVLATNLAVEDSGLREKGWTIEIIVADHQNRPDIATAIAREWADVQNVDVFSNVNSSGVALAINPIVVEKNRLHLNTGAASSALTGKACTPNTIHWTYDTHGSGASITAIFSRPKAQSTSRSHCSVSRVLPITSAIAACSIPIRKRGRHWTLRGKRAASFAMTELSSGRC